MKIAILTPTFHEFSGIDRVAQLQAEKFTRQGHRVTIIALDASIKGKGYKVISLGMPKLAFMQRLYRLFFFLDRKHLNGYKMLKGYDKVIAHFYPMTWLAYEAKKHYRTPYVYWDHGVNTTGLLDSIPQNIYMAFFKMFNNWTLRNVDEAYSVSKYLSDELWKQSKIRSKVIYNPIDAKRFNKKVDGSALRKKFGLNGSEIFLYVGRLAPHKGIHLLIEAFARAKESVPNAQLLIVGKETFKGYANDLKKLVERKNIDGVSFVGFVDDKDLPKYYAACDVYTTASQWEGFNLPVAEAQACGKPVVAFDMGSHREIVKNGQLIKNKDIDAFSSAMIKLLKNN
jgi:glycosyltransferase involved in cell wall biosynthesis